MASKRPSSSSRSVEALPSKQRRVDDSQTIYLVGSEEFRYLQFSADHNISKKYYMDSRGLHNIVRCLKDTGEKGSCYIFSGLFDLIASDRTKNWRLTLKEFVDEVQSLAHTIWSHNKAPVVIQLPWRASNNNNLLKVQRDEIRATLVSRIEKVQPSQRNLFISYKFDATSNADDVKLWKREEKEALQSFLLDEAKFFIQEIENVLRRQLDTSNFVHESLVSDKDKKAFVRRNAVIHADLVARYGHKQAKDHPDDKDRFSARYQRRDDAVQNRVRGKDHKKEARMVGYATVRKLDFHQGGFLSRCEFRSLWKNEHSPYRTNLTQVHNKSIYKTVREVLPGQAVEENDSFLQDFLFYVNRDGMMTFDTERQEYPPMVQFGCTSGSVFVFHSPTSVPNAIRDLAKNPCIIMLQCSAFADKVMLHQAFEVNGEVDSIYLNRIFLGAEGGDGNKSGGKFLAQLMYETSIPFFDPRRKPKKLDFDSPKPLTPDALVHACQDCRLPFAGLGMIVENYCQAFDVSDAQNILPIAHHILTSCVELPYLQKPGEPIWRRLEQLNSDFSGVNDSNSSTESRLLWQHRLLLPHDDADRLLQLTCAQGFYVTIDDYTLPVDLLPPELLTGHRRALPAKEFWPWKLWLPSSARTSGKNFNLGTRCSTCGHYGHIPSACDLQKSRTRCGYPFCRVFGHAVGACPAMFKRCGLCKLRGHQERDHGRYSHMDLVYTFLVWSPLNFHSSVVFLEYLDEYFPCMEDRLWKLQLTGRNRCESQKLFKMLQMEYKEPVKPDFEIDKMKLRRPDGRRKRR